MIEPQGARRLSLVCDPIIGISVIQEQSQEPSIDKTKLIIKLINWEIKCSTHSDIVIPIVIQKKCRNSFFLIA
ncbi:hypothetical protein Glove_374g8 [Diversispora epigaea]|uniref:Uncharacterized protein n=1 Tax=Diversispora epigaea TaxID=1348612 RepID=A0A397H5N2_9GLOM|nr:hypothetical protein Glove_374g8 [Diversispora epigaea]